MKTSVKQSRSASTITAAQVDRWLNQLDASGFKHEQKFEKRLRSISPTIVGFIRWHSKTYHAQVLSKAEVLAVVRRAIGSRNTHCEGERLRAAVVCDWAVRCALPEWIESRLPRWGNAGRGGPSTAKQLRELLPMMWANQAIEALHFVHDLHCVLVNEARDRGIASERECHAIVAGRVSDMLQPLVGLVDIYLRRYGMDPDKFSHVSFGAMSALLGDRSDEPLPLETRKLRQTLDDIVPMVLAVNAGDSSQSIADRCSWSTATRKASKSAA